MSAIANGIAGLTGREPIGAVVSIGTKGPKGNPIEKDRFHIVEVSENDKGVRPHHRLFSFFNQRDADKRKLINGNLVHGTRDECFEWHYKCQVAKGSSHPQRRPFCVGNGQQAVRWLGGDANNFKEIDCVGERCEFRQPINNRSAPCKPWMRLTFRLTWDEAIQAALASKGYPTLPSMIVKFNSGSWNTVRNVKGFFDQIENLASEFGIDAPKFFGFPFELQLTEKTNRERRSRFPVVIITPTMDHLDFFIRQREQLAQIGGPPRVEALTDQTQQEPEVLVADFRQISPGIPSE